MRLLLDTVTFVHLETNVTNVPYNVLALITDPKVDSFLSHISLIEMMGLSRKKGKGLPEAKFVEHFVNRLVTKYNIQLLPIDVQTIFSMSRLPFHHTDPFDRYLIATAIRNELTIVSPDRLFPLYEDAGLKMLW